MEFGRYISIGLRDEVCRWTDRKTYMSYMTFHNDVTLRTCGK